MYLVASQFITSSKTIGRFNFVQKHFQKWRSNKTSSGSLESLVSSAGSDRSWDSIGYGSCASEIVSVPDSDTNLASASTGGETRSDTPLKALDKFDNIAKEDRAHSSLDDLFSNLIMHIGKVLF